MGIETYKSVAERLRSSAECIREADRLQEGLLIHRLDRMAPLATALDHIAEMLDGGQIGAATKETYRLLLAVNKAPTLDLQRIERAELARLLGGTRSEKKSKAARENGSRGGRPRKDGTPARPRLRSTP